MLLSSHTLKLRNLYGIKQKKTNKITFRKYNTFHNSKDKKREEELNKIFEETFFRKPKVLIIGTDTSGLSCALSLKQFNITPDIIDTRHYMHKMAPPSSRGVLISIGAQYGLHMIGLKSKLENYGYPISYFSRTDETGKPYGSINYKHMEFTHKFPTIGIRLRDLEKLLYDEVLNQNMNIKQEAYIKNIDNLFGDDPKVAVEYIYKSADTVKTKNEIYDVVIIADGTFSPAKKMLWNKEYSIRGLCNMWEMVIKTPRELPFGHYVDMWGENKRFGYFPISRSELYVYGQFRDDKQSSQAPDQRTVSVDKFISHFREFGGHYNVIAKGMKEVGQCTETISLLSVTKNFHNGRVVCIGNAAATLPVPNLGNDVAIAVNSGNFIGSSLAMRSMPIESTLKKFEQSKKMYEYMSNMISSEIASSVVDKSPLWRWVKRLLIKIHNSDKRLTNRETAFFGAEDKVNSLTNSQVYEIMKKEFIMMPDEERIKMVNNFEESVKRNEKIIREALNKKQNI